MAASPLGCVEGFAADATVGTLYMQVQSLRLLASFSGLAIRDRCLFPCSPPLKQSLFSKQNIHVHVVANYSDCKPESYKPQGKWGYHPVEDLSKVEKEEIEHAGDGKLATAEVARTIFEVNWSVFILSIVVSKKDFVFGTEVQYRVDDHGNLYFDIENDNEFICNLSSTQIYTVLVGFGNVDRLQFSEVSEADESEHTNLQIYWEGMEDLEDLEDDSPEESFSLLGGWSGFESLEQVHPMDFASKVSKSTSADYISEIDDFHIARQ